MTFNQTREDILADVRAALSRVKGSPVPPIPPSAIVPPRTPGDARAEMDLLLSEIEKLGGVTRRVAGANDLRAALEQLVSAEHVSKAVLWDTAEIRELGIAAALESLGVEIVPASAGKGQIAECELGVTAVDAALPETGTLVLRSSPEKPRVISLLPRVHLAILRPSALRPDLRQAFADVSGDRYAVFVTGPSRTSDIELTLTIGVHGPKALYVWDLEDD